MCISLIIRVFVMLVLCDGYVTIKNKRLIDMLKKTQNLSTKIRYAQKMKSFEQIRTLNDRRNENII